MPASDRARAQAQAIERLLATPRTTPFRPSSVSVTASSLAGRGRLAADPSVPPAKVHAPPAAPGPKKKPGVRAGDPEVVAQNGRPRQTEVRLIPPTLFLAS